MTLILAGGSVGGGSPPVTAGEAQFNVSWNLPTQYTDGTRLRPNTYRVDYGTVSGGPYPNSADMSLDTDPAMLVKTITGVQDGTTYYGVVRTVDFRGNLSGNSSEFSVTAAIPDPSLPAADFTISTLPYTITQAGNYRIAAGSYTVPSGTAIVLSPNISGSVKIYADNDVDITWATTGIGQVIAPSSTFTNGSFSDVEVFGFSATHGGWATMGVTGSGDTVSFFSNKRSSGPWSNIHFRDLDIVMGGENFDSSSAWFAFYCRDMNSSSDMLFTRVNATLYGRNARLFENDSTSFNNFTWNGGTVRFGKYNASLGGYLRLNVGAESGGSQGFGEVYGAKFYVEDAFNSGSGGVLTGFGGENTYVHGCKFYVVNSHSVRWFILDGSSNLADNTRSVLLYCDFENSGTSADGDPAARAVRVRVPSGTTPNQSDGLIMGFCTARSTATNGDGICVHLGGDLNQGAVSCILYDNDIEGYQNAIQFEGQAHDIEIHGGRYVGDSYGITFAFLNGGGSMSNISVRDAVVDGGTAGLNKNISVTNVDFENVTNDSGGTLTENGSGSGYDTSSTTAPETPNLTPNAPTGVTAAA